MAACGCSSVEVKDGRTGDLCIQKLLPLRNRSALIVYPRIKIKIPLIMFTAPFHEYSPLSVRSVLASLSISLLLVLWVSDRTFAPDQSLVEVGVLDEIPENSSLGQALDIILDDPSTPLGIWGIHIRDLRTGQSLYSRYGDLNLVPASNLKLFTTAAALDALGSEYRYQTRLRFNGQAVGDSILMGDLILEGSGDPTFGSRRFDTHPLRDWAEGLADMGVTLIQGRIVGDGRIFGNTPYAEGWDVSHIATQTYAPSAGGLSYRDNLVSLTLRGNGQIGLPPLILAEPDGFVEIRNLAVTSTRRRFSTTDLDRVLGTNTFTIEGSLRPDYRGSMRAPIHDPTAYTLHIFLKELERAGINVSASLVDAREIASDLSYSQARTFFVHTSPPLSEIITIINKQSDNFYAEQLFRTIAWGGSMDGGERRIKNFLSRSGIRADNLVLRDGSGLSRKNMVSPSSLTGLLTYMYWDHPDTEAFVASLPEGGESETTLRGRLEERNVRAKTGSLEFVRGLSGYIHLNDGTPLAFSIVVNNYSGQPFQIRRVVDDLVEAISRFNPGV